MSNSSLTKAWQWSVIHSPILNTWRWLKHMGYPNYLAFPLLKAAQLPKPVGDVISMTIVKSKLWATERAEIARELIAHAHDAIDAGRSAEEIVESFGDPKRVAKLMRRSMKRKRPLYWRAYRNMKRASAAMVLILIVGYGGLAVRFYMGTPNIKQNYIAKMNAQNEGYSEDEKAWGVYRDVEAQWQRNALEVALLREGNEHKPIKLANNRSSFQSTSEDYAEMMGLVQAFEAEIALVREAASRPIMGMVYSSELETVEVDGVYVSDSIEPAANPEDQGLLISVLLPEIGIGRGLVNVLMLDANLAAQERDTDRVIKDIEASLRIGVQVGNTGPMISSRVAISIVQITNNTIEFLLKEHPGLFSSEELEQIAGLLDQASKNITMQYDMEIWMFEDFLQRAYTDDGHGNGRITARGIKMLMEEDSAWMYYEADDPMTVEGYFKVAASPAALLAVEDRKTQSLRFAEHIKQTKQVILDGPESIGWLDFHHDRIQEASRGHVIESPMDVLAVSMRQSVNKVFWSQMKNEAMQTTIAIERYRIETGHYPDSIDLLVPGYIDEIPEDLFRLGNPIQYVLDGEGYRLYSGGSDGDLDGGRGPIESMGEHNVYSFIYRYRFLTSEEFDADEVEVLFDRSGKPRLDNRDCPDGDWVLIDMRSSADSQPEG